MKLEVEVCESDLVDQNEYADWYCSRYADWHGRNGNGLIRVGEAGDGHCRVRCGTKEGDLSLLTLTLTWDGDGEEEDLEALCGESADYAGPCEDFDVTTFVWGLDEQGLNVLWGVS